MLGGMSAVAVVAQVQTNPEWYQHQMVGVLLGAVITAATAFLVTIFNVRHLRAVRWDEPRRLVYSRFLAVVVDLNTSGHAEALARWSWIRATDDRRESALTEHAARVDDFNRTSRRLYDLRAELKLLATAPVERAAQATVDGTIERQEIVEAVFEDTSRTPSSELAVANERWQRLVDRFAEAAACELGVKES